MVRSIVIQCVYVLGAADDSSEDEGITPTYMTKDNGRHLLGYGFEC